MATLSEEIASLQSALTSAQQRVGDDLKALQQQVTDLQTQVQTLQDSLASATLTPDQQAALDAVVAGINQLDVPDVPPAPTPPAPAPQPMRPKGPPLHP